MTKRRTTHKSKRDEQRTLKQLAAALKISVRSLNTWLARGCPRGPIARIRDWRANHVLPRKGGPRKCRDSDADRNQQSLQQRLNNAKAEDAEEMARTRRMKRRLLQKRLVPIAQVVRELAEIFTEVREIIESIPDAVAKEVPQQLRLRVYDAVRNKVAAAFKKLASMHSVGSAADGA